MGARKVCHQKNNKGKVYARLWKMYLYNMNGFGTETMYDYYIVMKFMFLVVKLFSHPSIVYASFTIVLP
jgi:hypothetical protein